MVPLPWGQSRVFQTASKTELVHHEDYRSRREAKASIIEYIEVFYNRQRRHSHLWQTAPLAFERAALSA